jgi:hypothetical protein
MYDATTAGPAGECRFAGNSGRTFAGPGLCWKEGVLLTCRPPDPTDCGVSLRQKAL